MTPAKLISNRVVQAIVDSLGDDLWKLVDEEIERQIEATDKEKAQIWLNEDGAELCITIFGCDKPLVVPFFICGVDMPYKRESTGQVEYAQSQIKNIRKLIQDFEKVANEAEEELAKILAVESESVRINVRPDENK